MKKVLFFYVKGCPYCAQARKARQELIEEKPEYARVEFNEVDEGAEPDLADQYDYWATAKRSTNPTSAKNTKRPGKT